MRIRQKRKLLHQSSRSNMNICTRVSAHYSITVVSSQPVVPWDNIFTLWSTLSQIFHKRQVTLPWSVRWSVQCLPVAPHKMQPNNTSNTHKFPVRGRCESAYAHPPPHQHFKHHISCLVIRCYLIHSGIRHLVTLISNKSRIQPFCAVVETLLGILVIILDAPWEVNILLHSDDPEILVAICQQVVQLDLVLFLTCPEDSPGSWTVEGTWSWAAHDRKSVQRAENVSKHASNAHLQLHMPLFFFFSFPFFYLATKQVMMSFHSTLALRDLLKFWHWMKLSSGRPL